MAGNWDWNRRKEYSKREVESLAMLREILSASKTKEKRAVISKFNPHFYLLFPDGVKHYEDADCARSQAFDGQATTTMVSVSEGRIFTQEVSEKENRDGI